MSPTKRVPAALHLELSEYASLLRTMRTTATLDFVPQLSQAQFADGEEEEDGDEDTEAESEDGGGEAPKPHGEGPSTPKQAKRKARQTPRRNRAQADGTWTQWPLLLEHCPVPEWGFDEEVKTIAEQSLRAHLSGEAPGGSSADDDLDQHTLSPAYLAGLTSDASSKLSSLFSLLARHRPNVTYTKHDRVDPMGWEDVLEAVGAAELFDESVVEDVQRRMEAIFGPSGSQVIHNMQVVKASKRALAAAEAEFGQDISSLVGPPPAKKRRRTKKREQSASEDDDEVDAAEQV